jgi:hypothetical protein
MKYSIFKDDGMSRWRKKPRRVSVLAALPALLIALGFARRGVRSRRTTSPR